MSKIGKYGGKRPFHISFCRDRRTKRGCLRRTWLQSIRFTYLTALRSPKIQATTRPQLHINPRVPVIRYATEARCLLLHENYRFLYTLLNKKLTRLRDASYSIHCRGQVLYFFFLFFAFPTYPLHTAISSAAYRSYLLCAVDNDDGPRSRLFIFLNETRLSMARCALAANRSRYGHAVKEPGKSLFFFVFGSWVGWAGTQFFSQLVV